MTAQRPPLRFIDRKEMTARELAQLAGKAQSTIMRWTAKPREDFEGRADDRRATIIDLHRQGLKGIEIAHRIGVTAALVSIRLKEARRAGIDLTLYPKGDTTQSPDVA